VPIWPSQVRALIAPELPLALAGSHLVGIHCWASWNGYDYKFADMLQSTMKKFVIDVFAMDVEHASNIELIASWGITNVPAFVIFQEEIRVATLWMQLETLADFRQRVENWLEGSPGSARL
jgi:thiol-disulfide isomerase/thioredoxin